MAYIAMSYFLLCKQQALANVCAYIMRMCVICQVHIKQEIMEGLKFDKMFTKYIVE